VAQVVAVATSVPVFPDIMEVEQYFPTGQAAQFSVSVRYYPQGHAVSSAAEFIKPFFQFVYIPLQVDYATLAKFGNTHTFAAVREQ
jgi:hypothetical protein